MNLRCFCGNVYKARNADIKRGWAKTCSKKCAAIKRTYKKPNAVNAETGEKIKYGSKPNYTKSKPEQDMHPHFDDYSDQSWDAHKDY